MSYSEELIKEIIICFEKEDGIVLTEEEAVLALEGLAGLFIAFSK